jgi:hypothetical protein
LEGFTNAFSRVNGKVGRVGRVFLIIAYARVRTMPLIAFFAYRTFKDKTLPNSKLLWKSA